MGRSERGGQQSEVLTHSSVTETRLTREAGGSCGTTRSLLGPGLQPRDDMQSSHGHVGSDSGGPQRPACSGPCVPDLNRYYPPRGIDHHLNAHKCFVRRRHKQIHNTWGRLGDSGTGAQACRPGRLGALEALVAGGGGEWVGQQPPAGHQAWGEWICTPWTPRTPLFTEVPHKLVPELGQSRWEAACRIQTQGPVWFRAEGLASCLVWGDPCLSFL